MPEFSEDGKEGTTKKSAICEQVQQDLAKLVQDIENKMSESSKTETESQNQDELLFATQEEVAKRMGLTPFNPNLKEEVMKMHQKSSNGVVANHALIAYQGASNAGG